MDKPKISTLRPSTTLEVLDRAFRVYRDNFGLIIGLVAIAMVPLTALNLFNSLYVLQRLQGITAGVVSPRSSSYTNTLLSTYTSTFLIAFISGLAQGLLVNAPLTYIASERFLGRRVTIGQAYRAVSSRLLNLGVSLILFYVIFGGLLAVAGVTMLCLVGLGLIGLVIFVGINFYAFLVPVIILERQGPTKSMSRAWSLAKARFWPLLWVTVAVFATTWAVSVALTSARVMIAGGTLASASYGASQIATIILTAVINMFVIPVLPLTYTMMYYDTRIRREGLDIALASVGVDEPRPADVASPPPGPFMVQQDWRSLVIVSVVGLVPLVLIVCLVFAFVGSLPYLR